MDFRPLTENEIECRVGTASEKGCSLLLYKDSRVDMRLLDEIYGVMGWQNSYKEIGGELFCTIEIWDSEKGQWIEKQSNGSPSNMEAEKGRASDALKRAGFMLGIGRELYTAPFVWITADKCNIGKNKQGKPTCYDRFRCEKVRIENGAITGLSIYNDTKKCRAFTWVKEEQK